MFYFKFQQHPGESVDKVIYFHKYFIYVDNQVSILEFYVLGTNCYFDVLITGTEEKKKNQNIYQEAETSFEYLGNQNRKLGELA